MLLEVEFKDWELTYGTQRRVVMLGDARIAAVLRVGRMYRSMYRDVNGMLIENSHVSFKDAEGFLAHTLHIPPAGTPTAEELRTENRAYRQAMCEAAAQEAELRAEVSRLTRDLGRLTTWYEAAKRREADRLPDAKDGEIARLNKLLNDMHKAVHGIVETGHDRYAQGYADGKNDR